VRTIRRAGEDLGGYFATPDDAETFEAELAYMLVHQIGAFNSPVWFNCGLFHEYGIRGSGAMSENRAGRMTSRSRDACAKECGRKAAIDVHLLPLDGQARTRRPHDAADYLSRRVTGTS
jgi:hypothetical protein